MKINRFKALSSLMAPISLALFFALMVSPELIFKLFDIPGHDSTYIMARRASVMFLGISALSWFGRDSSHSVSRQSVCIGLAIVMFGLGVLGLIELTRGVVSAGVLLAVVTELLIGVSYMAIWIANRNG